MENENVTQRNIMTGHVVGERQLLYSAIKGNENNSLLQKDNREYRNCEASYFRKLQAKRLQIT